LAYATVDELLAALRITRTLSPDETAAAQKCLDAAAYEIDHATDRRPSVYSAAAGWRYSSETVAVDPGSGGLHFDKSQMQAASALYISATDLTGVLHDELPLAGDYIDITAQGETASFFVEDDAIDNGGWYTVPVSLISPALNLTDGQTVTLVGERPNVIVGDGLALANRVNVLRAVEWWKSNDAAFGVIGFDQTGAVRAPRDSFARHASALIPLKERWGVA
jgi:hypothetical protein